MWMIISFFEDTEIWLKTIIASFMLEKLLLCQSFVG